MNADTTRIAIIGGGMAGLCAAVELGRKGLCVDVFERQAQAGNKILLTGNGKGNISNTLIRTGDYLTDEPLLLNEILNHEQNGDFLSNRSFFESLGLFLKEKDDRLYPVSNRTQSILHALLFFAKDANVTFYTGHFVNGIHKDNKVFTVQSQVTALYSGENESKTYSGYTYVLLAGGGKAGIYGEEGKNCYRITKDLSFGWVWPHPALVQAFCDDTDLKKMAGVRIDAGITLYREEVCIAKESGELQIIDSGLSGIPVFQLTRYIADPKKINYRFAVDFLPYLDESVLTNTAKDLYLRFKNGRVSDVLSGLLPKKCADGLLSRSLHDAAYRCDPYVSDMGEKDLEKILGDLKEISFKIDNLNGYKHAQISTGGVPLSDVMSSMEAKHIQNLYLAGEILNVAGKCGGYNLHFAALSGRIAADDILQKEGLK